MQWSDKAIILRLRKYGESSGILTVFTQTHGLYSGMVRSAFGKKQGVYQPGNLLEVTWQARMPEHLGSFQCELMESIAARVLHHPLRLLGLSAMSQLLEVALPEHEPFSDIFSLYLSLLGGLTQEGLPDITWLETLVRLEMRLLTELGFGLDISVCASTGIKETLRYVSPKTGRAVCEVAGQPYHDKLLVLPAFLRYTERAEDMGCIRQGLRLTGYFLNRYIFLPRRKTLPEARGRLVSSDLVVGNCIN